VVRNREIVYQCVCGDVAMDCAGPADADQDTIRRRGGCRADRSDDLVLIRKYVFGSGSDHAAATDELMCWVPYRSEYD